MRTIIAGSRCVTDVDLVFRAVLFSGINPSVVLSGAARGVDRLGEMWAEANSVPIERYPADWNTHGKSAGYVRNVEMADNADALIAIWDGESKGTKHMIDIAERKQLIVFIFMACSPKP